jgi:hypothetical protein
MPYSPVLPAIVRPALTVAYAAKSLLPENFPTGRPLCVAKDGRCFDIKTKPPDDLLRGHFSVKNRPTTLLPTFLPSLTPSVES